MTSPIQLMVQQAIQAFQDGNFNSATLILKRVLQVDSRNFAALHAIGLINASQANYQEAADYLGRAARLSPNDASVHYNLAKVLAESGNNRDALKHYIKVVALAPNNPEAWFGYGRAASNLNRHDDALIFYDRALSLKPDYYEVWTNRGVTLYALNCLNEALDSYNKALSLKSDDAQGWYSRGAILYALKNFEEALVCYDRALSLKSDYAECWYSRGVTLYDLRRLTESLDCYDKALSLIPNYYNALTNKGTTLYELKRFEEALDAYKKAIQLAPESIDANWNLSLLKLSAGDYLSGWELYEWRWKTCDFNLDAERYSKPLWLGVESLKNKTILIFSEQGLGDSIQFCRYIKMVADLGANIIFEVQEQLVEALSSLRGVVKIIPLGADLPEFDCYCPLLSLPLALKTTVETIPNEVPYLRPSPDKAESWRVRLGEGKNLRVGIAWSGGFRLNQPGLWGTNERRNIPLQIFTKIALPHIDFYSLQKGVEDGVNQTLLNEFISNGGNIFNFSEELHDYSDTAALIANLDLVISVDTSVAHMAGALGKPVWILNRFDSDWRWLVDRPESSWYPSAKIFNQPKDGDWASVIDEVRISLRQLQERV